MFGLCRQLTTADVGQPMWDVFGLDSGHTDKVI